jgi:hypothetical protein
MNTNRIAVAIGITLLLCLPGFSMGASPMVERHIFAPEEQETAAAEAAKEKSPEVERLEREILFTGIINGPDGKKAMIREKVSARNKEAEKGSLLKEGDEIRGMTLKEIGRNYLVLAGPGGDVRLNLFQEGKERPAPPPEPKAAETQPIPPPPAVGAQQEGASEKPPIQAVQPGQPQAVPRPGIQGQQASQRVPPTQAMTPGQEGQTPSSPGDTTSQPNPFADALKRAQQQNATQGRRNLVNPFLDAIRRSQGNTTQQQ